MPKSPTDGELIAYARVQESSSQGNVVSGAIGGAALLACVFLVARMVVMRSADFPDVTGPFLFGFIIGLFTLALGGFAALPVAKALGRFDRRQGCFHLLVRLDDENRQLKRELEGRTD